MLVKEILGLLIVLSSVSLAAEPQEYFACKSAIGAALGLVDRLNPNSAQEMYFFPGTNGDGYGLWILTRSKVCFQSLPNAVYDTPKRTYSAAIRCGEAEAFLRVRTNIWGTPIIQQWQQRTPPTDAEKNLLPLDAVQTFETEAELLPVKLHILSHIQKMASDLEESEFQSLQKIFHHDFRQDYLEVLGVCRKIDDPVIAFAADQASEKIRNLPSALEPENQGQVQGHFPVRDGGN